MKNIAIALAIMIGCVCLLGVMWGIPWLQCEDAIKNWRQTKATITHYAILKPASQRDQVKFGEIQYKYVVDGHEYIGNKYSFSSHTPILRGDKYSVGAEVKCFYNPTSPDQAVLARTTMPRPPSMVLGVTVASFFCGLLLFPAGVRDFLRGRKKNHVTEEAKTRSDITDSSSQIVVSHQPLYPNEGSRTNLYELKLVSPSRYEIVVKKSSVIYIALFMTWIVVFMIGLTVFFKLGFMGYLAATLLLVGAMVGFIWGVYKKMCIVPTFDSIQKAYWVQNKKQHQNDNDAKNYTTFSDIYAIQIINKSFAIKTTKFSTNELNLVLRSGERVFVAEIDRAAKIRDMANKLSGFMGVAVIDDIPELLWSRKINDKL